MRQRRVSPFLAPALCAIAWTFGIPPSGGAQEVRERRLEAPNELTMKVRMEGPYSADTPLQVVCYFEHKPSGDKTLGAAVELDRQLGGVIAALRNRGEFTGKALETLLLTPPKNTIKPQRLLLVGLGEESSLSLERLEQVGKVALRAAATLGVKRVAFAPLIRDQGNSRFEADDVEHAVTRGMILAYDTERRLQKEGLAPSWTLEEWAVEAGPDYFDSTIHGVQQAIEQAKAAIAQREARPYSAPR